MAISETRLTAPRQIETQILLYPRREAARSLGISSRTLDYLISNKKIATRRIGSRVLIPFAELKRFAANDHPFTVTQP